MSAQSTGKQRLARLIAEHWPQAVELGRRELEHLPGAVKLMLVPIGGADGVERAAERLVAELYDQIPDDDAAIDAWLTRAARRLLEARSTGLDPAQIPDTLDLEATEEPAGGDPGE